MNDTLKFKLVTPERVLFEEEVLSITVPTHSGEITILPGHVQLVSALADGVAELKRPDGTLDEVAVSDGFIHVKPENRVVMIAEMAERGADVDLQAIEKAKAASEKLMKEEFHAAEETDIGAAAAMSRELAKYRAALRYQKRTGAARPQGPKTEE